MKYIRKEKGIAIVVLIITIIVMLILVTVTINYSIKDGGLISKANNAKEMEEIVQEKDKINLARIDWISEKECGKIAENEIFFDYMENKLKEEANIEIKENSEDVLLITWNCKKRHQYEVKENSVVLIKNEEKVENVAEIIEARKDLMLSKTENTVVKDKYGNKVVIPAGFKVTEDADNVAEGIVITDGKNEFVWIPVGNIKKNGKEEVSIKLSRYDFNKEGIYTAKGNEPIRECQELFKSYNGKNVPAENIFNFKLSVLANGGYYIGRYEARNRNSEVTCNKNDDVYNYVTQEQAAAKSRKMYNNNFENGTFASDLVNSYAWDTAVVFLQECGYDKKYSVRTSLYEEKLELKGTEIDKNCNIYDLISNCYEWTTEACLSTTWYVVDRGGSYENLNLYTAQRLHCIKNLNTEYISFRPILYLAINNEIKHNCSKVEYLEGTGSQYINTGLKLLKDYKVKLEFEITNNLNNTWIFGTGNVEAGIYGDGLYKDDFSYTDCGNNKYIAEAVVMKDQSFSAYIFGRNWSGDDEETRPASIKLYSCKIYDENNNLIRNFIPSYSEDLNELGLYDSVEQKFYMNEGTDVFKTNT